MKRRCICGCGRKKGLHKHHAVTQAELRRIVRSEHKASGVAGPPDVAREMMLCADRRNIVMVAWKCHLAHHNAKPKLRLNVLPDSVYEFAAEVLGAGAAYEYLARHYAGGDPRLDALLEAEAA